MFKKYATVILMAAMFSVMIPAMSGTAVAQKRYYSSRTRTNKVYKRPNVYRRHRKAFNIGIGTGVGMLVGGLLGGKKGVVIGGLGGAGGGALFTHYQKPKNRVRYYRRY